MLEKYSDYIEVVNSKKRLRQITIHIKTPNWQPSLIDILPINLEDHYSIIVNPFLADILCTGIDNSCLLLLRADSYISAYKNSNSINVSFSFFKTDMGGVFAIYISSASSTGFMEVNYVLKYSENARKVNQLWQRGMLHIELAGKGTGIFKQKLQSLTKQQQVTDYIGPKCIWSLTYQISDDCVMSLTEALYQLVVFHIVTLLYNIPLI
jgi:hypothetical protein